MSAANSTGTEITSCRNNERGSTAVEFSLLVIGVLILVFGSLELARAMYVINTLQEVTRRAASGAATADFRDQGGLAGVRANAIFRNTSGPLVLADPVTDANVIIDYLSISRDASGNLTPTHIDAGSLPSCPARNHLTCLTDTNDPKCIQLVRARICASADDSGNCTPVQYQMLFPLVNLSFTLPTSTTILPAGSLGYTIGSNPCP
jgi:hypothetical protein